MSRAGEERYAQGHGEKPNSRVGNPQQAFEPLAHDVMALFLKRRKRRREHKEARKQPE